MLARDRDYEIRVHADFAQLAIIVVMILGFLFVLGDRPTLPPKFSNDPDKIQEIALGQRATLEDLGYQRVGDIYRSLGLADQRELAGAIGYGIFCLTLLPLLKVDYARRFTVVTLFLTLASIVLGAVYLGTYSKDVFVLPIVALAIMQGRTIKSDLVLLSAMAVYAYYLREYWYLIAAFYIALRLSSRSGVRISRLLLVTIAGIVVLAFLFPVLEGVPLNHYREAVNLGRAESVEAQTMMASYIPVGGELGGFLNTCLTLVLLFFPIPLLLLGTAYHAVLFGIISTLWGRFFYGLERYARAPVSDPRLNRLVCLAIAFVTVQSVFEPDYGSYLRHLTPLLPVVIFALAEFVRLEARDRAIAPRRGAAPLANPRPAPISRHA